MYSTDKPSTLKDIGKDATFKKGWYSIVAQYEQIHHKAQEAMKEWQPIGIVFEGQVSRLEKDRNWTRPAVQSFHFWDLKTAKDWFSWTGLIG